MPFEWTGSRWLVSCVPHPLLLTAVMGPLALPHAAATP